MEVVISVYKYLMGWEERKQSQTLPSGAHGQGGRRWAPAEEHKILFKPQKMILLL